jgi:hypothetical protein
MAAEIIDDKGLWDGFIDESPHGLLFHKWDFLKIIEKYTHFRLLRYGIYEGRELVGVIPIFYKSMKGIKMAYSPPQGTLAYIPYMGPVMGRAYSCLIQRKKEDRFALVWGDIRRELKKLSPNFTSIMLAREMDDMRPIEATWDSMESDFRKAIKKSKQYGLSAKQGTDVNILCNIMADRLKERGTTFFQRQSPEYLTELMAAYPDNLQMTFLYLDDRIIGAKLDCIYKGSYIGWCGGTEINPDIPANDFFEWETIKEASSLGCKFYENWGGDMRRLNMFKSKLNPTLVPYYHLRKKDALGKLSDWGYDMISENPYLGFVKKMIA